MFRLVGFYIKLILGLSLAGALMRILFALINRSYFSEISFQEGFEALLLGLRFDLSIAALLALVPLLLAWVIIRMGGPIKLHLFGLLALYTLVMIQGADMMYFLESRRHIGYEVKGLWLVLDSLILTAFKDNIALSLGFLAFVALTGFFFLKNFKEDQRPSPSFHPMDLEFSLVLLLALNVVFIRGGVQAIPIKPAQVYNLTDRPKQASLAMNGAFHMVSALSRKGGVEKQPIYSIPQGERDQLLERGGYFERKPLWRNLRMAQNQNYNIFLVLLESFNASFLSQGKGAWKNPQGQPFMPFFKTLTKQSFRPLEALANGLRTSEGLFALSCSAQNPLGGAVINSHLQNHDFLCLPKILSDRGWQTLFVQGTLRETSGVGALAKRVGFQESYGKEDFNSKETLFEFGTWGAHDPDIYGFVLKKLEKNEIKEPFLVGINTNSTHGMALPKGAIPFVKGQDPLSEKMNIYHFADQSLERFMNSPALKKLRNPSVFVFVSDHTSGAEGGLFDTFSIPLLIYAPQTPGFSGRLKTAASQRDVAPTLLDLLGQKIPSSLTGRSLLRPSKRGVDYYKNGFLGWIVGDYRVETRLQDRSLHRCYKRKQRRWEAQTCEAIHQNLAHQGVAFTSYFQDLLFSNRLKEFGHSR